MKLIVDANVLFALSKPSSVANEILSRHKLTLLAPSFALIELYKHRDELVKKTGISDFNKIIESLKEKVTFVDEEEYRQFIKTASALTPDSDDISYIALGLRFFIPIWSNDLHFKQQAKLTVFNTEELVKFVESIP